MTRTTYDFENRVAVVTGGVRGIGLAVVERLLQGGARVAVWDIDAQVLARQAEALGPRYPDRVIGLPCDLSRTEQVQAAADETRKRLGDPSILVNNAALVYPERACLDVPDEEWLRMYDVNVVGMHRACRALVPAMVTGGYGRVVNMGSAAGKNGNERLSAYSATKAAIINYTKVSGRELARSGVLVNCVAPSATHTDGLATVSEEQRKLIASWIPMQRFAEPGEIAALVVWLCSDECTFTTGATFDAAGGRTFY